VSGTLSLALATLAFVGTHLALSHPLRLGLVRNFGEARFVLLYSVVAAVTLGWMIFAYDAADETPLWIAPVKGWSVALILMLLASILLVGSFVRNPAFPHPGAKPKAPRPATGVFAITRHPMNWSFILWALVHIALWGSPRNLIVAGGILFLAVAGSIGQDRKKRASLGQSWRDWEARTSFVPFGALLSGRAKWRAAAPGWIAVIGGTLLWLAITWYHSPAVSPIVALTD
jgi:uncharacterized membrane protein